MVMTTIITTAEVIGIMIMITITGDTETVIEKGATGIITQEVIDVMMRVIAGEKGIMGRGSQIIMLINYTTAIQ